MVDYPFRLEQTIDDVVDPPVFEPEAFAKVCFPAHTHTFQQRNGRFIARVDRSKDAVFVQHDKEMVEYCQKGLRGKAPSLMF